MDAARSLEWLVLRAQAGDRAALEQLLLETQRLLRRYVETMTGDADDGADVMQDVLITIYRRLPTLRDSRAYLGWGRRIASRAVFAMLRRRQRLESLPDEPERLEALAAGSDEPRATPELLEELPALLQKVSPASREVLVLHYLEELSLEEVAAVLDLPLGTVKSRLGYGLRTLRAHARSKSARR